MSEPSVLYSLFYVSQDHPGDDSPWSVYRELYVSQDAAEPINNSTSKVSTHYTGETDARAFAEVKQNGRDEREGVER